ncbi:hypothetical protein PF007_g8803 [Phytophthora fragariae]|uniref:Uncharacterized protein n=1 Tax=Phytophthora fragariae TaxID=53985 RepID=A0A6A3SK29_9STRA|nr:hypothetical protein PF003_g12791 [Phytophthora fragariae]KAE9118771.1 hypothetical protein PF007_g8803 [Phytophthora fragariae]
MALGGRRWVKEKWPICRLRKLEDAIFNRLMDGDEIAPGQYATGCISGVATWVN